jgi:hypothetical protein
MATLMEARIWIAVCVFSLALGCATKKQDRILQPVPGTDGASSGLSCGSVSCRAGQICCNASCGICTPPDGVCMLQVCDESPAPAAAGHCRQDDDCRLMDDYCGGCHCRSLAEGQMPPACEAPLVQCFAAPCLTRVARCHAGVCTTEAQAAAPNL